MKAWLLLLSILGALQAFGIDKPVFGTREDIAAALGDVSEPVKNAPGSLAKMEVSRFKKDGYAIIAYFSGDYSYRVIIAKENGTALTDQEITAFLSRFRSSWERWELPRRRAWVNNVKGASPRYALVTKDNKALDLLAERYLYDLGEQTWLDSTELSK